MSPIGISAESITLAQTSQHQFLPSEFFFFGSDHLKEMAEVGKKEKRRLKKGERTIVEINGTNLMNQPGS